MDLMTTEEVAAETRVPVNTLRYYRARGAGEGPRSAKYGRRVMYRRADVEAWLQEQYEASNPGDAA
ncbi:helix-turn-helix domain-containing protein [Cellulomonas soli]|uniref:helix-turn-helix domain-containing protein n=1 Tax=Cellulomonas soli TaxID=931535 RepID=UPI003F852545